MFVITNKQLKKIVGPQIFNWDTAFKNTDFISLIIGTSEDNKMLKLTIWDDKNPSYTENHFFEDYEEILKTIEEVLLFPAYEKSSDSKYHERIFEELDETFYYLGRKCTTYVDYLRKTSKDAYIKVNKYELLRLLDKLIGPVPEYLIKKIRQESSKNEDNKILIYFSKLTDFEQDDRIAFNVTPCIVAQIITAHGHQDIIENILLAHSYDWNIIEKEELFDRIDELNKIFKVKKDKKYFENELDLIKENFLVCPKENFLKPLKLPPYSPNFSFIWNQKPFDLSGSEWEAYKSKEEVDEKFEQANNNGNKEKPKINIRKWWEDSQKRTQKFLKEYKLDWIKPKIKGVWKPKSIYDIIWDEFTQEEIAKAKETNEGEKNNMNTNKNKPMRPDSIMIDEKNKVVVAFLNGKKFKVVCGKDDKFDFRIGLGVIVSKMNDSNKELQYLRQNMNWKQYYLYCYNKFFYFNSDRIKAFENAVYAEKEQHKLKLDEEKVRKFRCEEVEMSVYKPKKISHDFILFNPQGE